MIMTYTDINIQEFKKLWMESDRSLRISIMCYPKSATAFDTD